MAKYRVTITTDGTNIKAVQKACKEAFGADISAQVEKIERNPSRSDRLSDAEGAAEDARLMVEELRDELQGWRDNLPENVQDGNKASELDDAISALEEIISNMESLDFGSVTFPGMMG
jgi:hypothetical protein